MKDEGGRRKEEAGRRKEEGGRRKARKDRKERKERKEEGGSRGRRGRRKEEGGVCLFVCCVWRVACGVCWVKVLVRVNSWFPRGKRTIEEFEKVEVREGSEKVNKPEKHRVNFSGS